MMRDRLSRDGEGRMMTGRWGVCGRQAGGKEEGGEREQSGEGDPIQAPDGLFWEVCPIWVYFGFLLR